MAEQMKPSGIDWIGDVPANWYMIKLKYFSYLKGRIGWQGLTADEFIDEGPYLITGTDFENGKIQFDRSYHISDERYNQAPEIQLKVGDLLVTKDGTVGKMAYVDTLPGKASLNSHLLLIRPLENKFDNRFLFWLMSSSVFNGYTEYAQDGTVMASLSQEKIGNFIAYFPEITEQQAIADFLDKECAQIDSIAADLEKQIVLLQQYKKSLITETVTKGLDKSVPMKDSGVEWIGKIPAHWDFKRLKFMLENSSDSMKVGPFGSALSGSDFTDEGKWVYNQRVVLDNNFSENTTFVSEEKFQEMRSFAVYPGDILITTRGTIGKVAIVPEGANEGILHPCIIKFRVDKEMIIPELLQLIFNESDFVKDQFTLMSNATTIEVIYSYSLKDILLPVIPADEQEKIYAYLSKKCMAIDGIIAEKQKALATITQHKKSLIYEYVTGKKRVKEVQ